MCKGTVKWFNDNEGVGVIAPEEGGKDLLVRDSAIRGASHYKSLDAGQRVVFDTEQGPDGPAAINVTVIQFVS